MSIFVRFNRFRARNEGAVLRKVVQEILARIWRKAGLRHIIGPLLPVRYPKRWVFMGGCYNSGTTILREILGAHPEIATLPHEGVELTSAFPDLEMGGWQRMWYRNAKLADLSDQNPKELAQRAIRDWSPWWHAGAKVFLEKSIFHGAWMPTLQQGFENALFVGVIRNGYCACEGIRRRARPLGSARLAIGADNYPLEEVGRQWVYSNEVLLRDRDCLKQYHEVRYESFTADPVVTVRALFRFIGVSEDALIDEGGGILRVGTRTFNIRNQNAESLARLSNTEKDKLTKIIGPMMDRLGYVTHGQE
jgi:hypothetical protein